jgi:hypothetical protein
MTHHTRYPRAAVASGNSELRSNPPHRISPSAPAKPVVLWASRALSVQGGGRLVGVRRLSSTEVEVAWLGQGGTRVEWVPAELLLNEQKARRWLARARFSR